MKLTKLTSLILTLTLILGVFSLTACNTAAPEESAAGSVTLVVKGSEEKSYTVSLDGLTVDKGLVSILDALKSEGKLDYGITGTFLDYVGEVKNDYDKGEYIYVYTSIEADHDVSAMRHSITYNGKELVSAGIGAAEMTVKDGAIFYVAPHTPTW